MSCVSCSPAKPSLRTVPQGEFEEQLATLLKDHMVVAFVENGVSKRSRNLLRE